MRPQPWHILVLLLVILLLFGAGKLPSLARNVGKSMRIFKSEVDELRGDENPDQDEDLDELDRDRRRAARGREVRDADLDRRVRDDRDLREADRRPLDREYDVRTDERALDRDLDRERDRVHVRDQDSYRRD